jgi:hypothetical protein
MYMALDKHVPLPLSIFEQSTTYAVLKKIQKPSNVTRSWPNNLYVKKVDHLPT